MHAKGEIDLRLIAIEELVPHEETVPHLSDRLSHKMLRDSVQRDPIIVDGKTRIVLDGMHRLAALKRMGARSAVASVVDYMSDGVKLFRWYRFLEEPHENVVSAALRELAPTEEVPFSWQEAASHPGLTLVCRGRAYSSRSVEGLDSVMEATRRFDRVVRELGAQVGYVDEGAASPELLKGSFLALVTPKLRKGDVVRAAQEGRLFPPKTTLHVLPVRPMGINYPIEALRAQDDMLSRILATRTHRRIEPPSFYRGRLYREPVVVLE